MRRVLGIASSIAACVAFSFVLDRVLDRVFASSVEAPVPSDELRMLALGHTGVWLELPRWQEQPVAVSRARMRATTIGSPTLDTVADRALDVLDASPEVQELVLLRDPAEPFTAAVHVWMIPNRSRTPLLTTARSTLPRGVPNFFVLRGPEALDVPGALEAVVTRTRRMQAFRGSDVRHASITDHVALRTGRHEVQLALQGSPSDWRAERIFARVIASIRVDEEARRAFP